MVLVDGLIPFIVLVWFVLIVWAKLAKKTIKEIMQEIGEMIKGIIGGREGKKEEEGGKFNFQKEKWQKKEKMR